MVLFFTCPGPAECYRVAGKFGKREAATTVQQIPTRLQLARQYEQFNLRTLLVNGRCAHF